MLFVAVTLRSYGAAEGGIATGGCTYCVFVTLDPPVTNGLQVADATLTLAVLLSPVSDAPLEIRNLTIADPVCHGLRDIPLKYTVPGFAGSRKVELITGLLVTSPE